MSITYHLAEWGGNYGHVEIKSRCYNFRAPKRIERFLRRFVKCFFITTQRARYVFDDGKPRKLVLRFK
jgi:hypothetical protein